LHQRQHRPIILTMTLASSVGGTSACPTGLNVTIVSLAGEVCVLAMSCESAVLAVKAKIQEHVGIPAREQRLFSRGYEFRQRLL